MALGIGANAAIFSVINAVLLRPLPYGDPDRLVMIWETDEKTGGATGGVSYPDFEDWRAQSGSFQRMAAVRTLEANVIGSGTPDRLRGAVVTSDFFRLLGVAPALGRAFLPEEDAPDRGRVVILSHGLWQSRFGGDPGVLGKTVRLEGDGLQGEGYLVIGVMPPGFRFRRDAEIWTPVGTDRSRQFRGMHSYAVVARLNPGVAPDRAQAEMTTIASRLERQYASSNAGRGARVRPLHEDIVGDVRPTLFMLLAAVGFILLIACANVANLLLVRANAREREVAIRSALGAGRVRLVRQFLIESLVLAFAGGTVGLTVAYAIVELVVPASAVPLPRVDELKLDASAFGYALLISLITGILFGLAPALQISKTDLQTSLKEGRALVGLGHSRLRHLLVVSEVALAVLLVTGAGLLIRSFWRLQDVDPGFKPENVLTARIELPTTKYRDADWPKVVNFYAELIRRLDALPGAASVGAAFSHSLDSGFTTSFVVEGRTPPDPGTEPESNCRPVTPEYFQTMGVRLLEGRLFTERDDAGAPGVTIINEAMARQFFLGEDPVGRRFSISWPPQAFLGVPGTYEVIGIVANERFAGLQARPEPAMYFAHRQFPFFGMSLVIRTATDPSSLAAAVRQTIWEMDRDLPVYDVGTMDELLAESVGEPRFRTLLLTLFAAVGLLLAAVGIYGVMAYSVSQRTREIGLRMAMGAGRGSVLRQVLGEGLRLTIAGLAIGLAGALALTRSLSSLLFGISPTDPATFAVVAVVLTGVALAGSYVPARRAALVDPMEALRYE